MSVSDPAPLPQRIDGPKTTSTRSVNFEDLENSGASLNNSGYFSPESSANFGDTSPRPNKPQLSSAGSGRNELMVGNRKGSYRPGFGSNVNSSSRSASSQNESFRRENSRNNLLQTMRSIRGLKPRVYVRKFSVGGMRYAAEKRQIAGMMIMFGLACVFQPLYSISVIVGSGGTTPTVGTDFAILFGDCCLLVLGIMAVGIGFAEFIVEEGDEKYTTALLLWAQTGFIWIIAFMTDVGRLASGSVGFIPEAYGPSVIMNRFIGAMAMIGILAYGFAMVGSIAFMGFSLYAFQVMKPHDRDRDYYVSRCAIYCGVLFVAGLAQFLIGIFIIEVYGMKLDKGPIQVGFFLINVPVLTALVGVLQAVAGLWGFMRSFGLFVKGRTDNRFQKVMAVLWIVQLTLQCLVQSAYLPGSEGAGYAAAVAGLSFALNFMPFYLDFKVRMTLKRLKPGYFGLVEDEEMPSDEEADPRPTKAQRNGNVREMAKPAQDVPLSADS